MCPARIRQCRNRKVFRIDLITAMSDCGSIPRTFALNVRPSRKRTFDAFRILDDVTVGQDISHSHE